VNSSIKPKFEQHFLPRVHAFAADVGDANFSGIPEPHLPLWGVDYESSSVKLAFIGKDTRYWGDMRQFLAALKSTPEASLYRHLGKFRELGFSKGTVNFGTSFWDTVMQLLAQFYGVGDWRDIKQRKLDHLLRGFLWAETNSVELWGSTPSKEDADYTVWKTCKDAGAKHFDSIEAILQIFEPKIVIVMDWDVPDSYWGNVQGFQTIGEHVRFCDHLGGTSYIYNIAHPNWLRGERRSDTFSCLFKHMRGLNLPLPLTADLHPS
jgi:hypothetical protein